LKAVTHDIFSLGVGLYFVISLMRPTPILLLLTVWLAVAINELIDLLGHVTRGDRPVRSFWTHSIFTVPVWGISCALVSAYLLGRVTGNEIGSSEAVYVTLLGTVIAYSHLLLDALTEGGVFLWRRRIALAHLRYDNLVLNAVFVGLGALLILAALL
jgi:energy-converting hydrogenase Eha subunit A